MASCVAWRPYRRGSASKATFPSRTIPEYGAARQVQGPQVDHPGTSDPPTPSHGGGIRRGARRLDHGQREGVPEVSPHPQSSPRPSRAADADSVGIRRRTESERRQTAFSPKAITPHPPASLARPGPPPPSLTGPSSTTPMPCAAEAVRTSPSWSIFVFMQVSAAKLMQMCKYGERTQRGRGDLSRPPMAVLPAGK